MKSMIVLTFGTMALIFGGAAMGLGVIAVSMNNGPVAGSIAGIVAAMVFGAGFVAMGWYIERKA